MTKVLFGEDALVREIDSIAAAKPGRESGDVGSVCQVLFSTAPVADPPRDEGDGGHLLFPETISAR